MTEQIPQSASGNTLQDLPQGFASEIIERSIDQLDRSDLDQHTKEEFLVDEFIGTTFRVQGAKDAVDTLTAVSRFVGEEIPVEGGGTIPWTRTVTRKDGLRRAGFVIDKHVPAALVSADRKIKYVSEGDEKLPVLMTADQIISYLNTSSQDEKALPGHENASSWKQIILDGILGFAKASQSSTPVWELIHNPEQGIEPVRIAQNNWMIAKDIAIRAGVDVDLLTRSAKFMNQNVNDPVMGAGILLEPRFIVGDDYSHLVN